MNRLFTRISIGVFLSVLVSVSVFGVFVAVGIVDSLSNVLPPDIRTTAELLQQVSYEMEERDFERLVKKTNARSQLPIKIVDVADDDIPDNIRGDLARGAIRWGFTKRDHFYQSMGLMIYIPVVDYTKVYVSGPDTHFPMPDFKGLMVTALFVSVVVLVFGYSITRPLQKDLRRLERAATELERGRLTARARVKSKNAIGKVGRKFDEMADRVQELLENRMTMIQAIAHELRTPIARVRFGVEMLADESSETEKERRAASIETDLAELEKLIQEFLVFVRYDEMSESSMTPGEQLVDRLITAQIERLAPMHPNKSVSLETVGEVDTRLYVDAKSFERVVHNLLSNALRFAESTVRVTLEERPSELRMLVEDDGPGIPGKSRRKVLEPFVRLDGSRSRDSGGVGLGLAIVSRIMKSVDGELEIDTSPLKGARVVTSWRRDRSHAVT